MSCVYKNTKGFSLVEVMIAVVLLGLISVLIFQSMGATTKSKNRFEKKDEAFRSASLTLNRMASDISSAVIFMNVEFLGVSSIGEQQTKSVFQGTNQGDQDKLIFESLSHVRYFQNVRESDMAEVEYFLEKSDQGSDLYDLKKREESPPDAEPEKGGTTYTLLEGVHELNFRYYDPIKQDFVEEWDTTKADYVGKLPRAVEIILVVQDPVDREAKMRFQTTVLLEMSPGPSDF